MLSCQKACNAVWDQKCAERRTYNSWHALLKKQAWRHHGKDFWLRIIQAQGTCMTGRAPPHAIECESLTSGFEANIDYLSFGHIDSELLLLAKKFWPH